MQESLKLLLGVKWLWMFAHVTLTYCVCTSEQGMKGVRWPCSKKAESPVQRWMGKHTTAYDVRQYYDRCAQVLWECTGEATDLTQVKEGLSWGLKTSSSQLRLGKGTSGQRLARTSLTTNILTWFSKWLRFPRASFLSFHDLSQLLLDLFILMTTELPWDVESTETRPWSLCISSPSR